MFNRPIKPFLGQISDSKPNIEFRKVEGQYQKFNAARIEFFKTISLWWSLPLHFKPTKFLEKTDY